MAAGEFSDEPTVVELQRHAWSDRDLSWLAFNRRVLDEAIDERTPLLERVKFLAIFTSNLDEFFMKRMAAIRPAPHDISIAAVELREVLQCVRDVVVSMLADQAACYSDVIKPRLAAHGVHLLDWESLSAVTSARKSRRASRRRSRPS